MTVGVPRHVRSDSQHLTPLVPNEWRRPRFRHWHM